MTDRTEYFRLYFKEARLTRKRLGVCVQCGQQPALPDRTRCSDCNNDQRQADARYRALLRAAHDVRDVHMEGQPDWAEVYAKVDKKQRSQ